MLNICRGVPTHQHDAALPFAWSLGRMLPSEKFGYSACKSFPICAVENFVKPRSLNTLAKQSWFVSSLFSCMTLLLGDGFLGEHPSPGLCSCPIFKSTEMLLAKLSTIAHSRKIAHSRINDSIVRLYRRQHINEGLPKNLRPLELRLLHSFHEPRGSWGRISTRRVFRNTPEHSTEILGSSSSTERLRGR